MTKLYVEGPDCTWTVPGQQSRSALRVDVPNGPAELAAWLNARCVPEGDAGGRYDLPEQPPTVAPVAPNDAGAGAAIAAGADQVADWILDRASAAEVERLFSCLGARFHELRKAAA